MLSSVTGMSNASHPYTCSQSTLLRLRCLLLRAWSSSLTGDFGLPRPTHPSPSLPSCTLMLAIKGSRSQEDSLPRYGQGLPASFQPCRATEGRAGRECSLPGIKGLTFLIPDIDPQIFPKGNLTLVEGSGVLGWSLVLRPEPRAPFPPNCYSCALYPGVPA